MASFGENLKALRTSRGYTQQRFAEVIGSNQSNVTSWERGFRMPNLETIKGIADIFKVPLSSLISIEETGMPEDKERELLDIIQANPTMRDLIGRIRYLSDDDLSLVMNLVDRLLR